MAISAYTKTAWVNGTTPAISATNLDHIEAQLKDITDAVLTPTSWTPTIIGSTTAGTQTYSVQVGRYIKIGKLVMISGYVVITAKDAGIAGDIRIGGLPFSADSTSNSFGSCAVSEYKGITLTTNYTQLGISFVPNNTYMYVEQNGSAQTPAFITVSNLAAASSFIFSGTYISNT